jgi:hypothetical protein
MLQALPAVGLEICSVAKKAAHKSRANKTRQACNRHTMVLLCAMDLGKKIHQQMMARRASVMLSLSAVEALLAQSSRCVHCLQRIAFSSQAAPRAHVLSANSDDWVSYPLVLGSEPRDLLNCIGHLDLLHACVDFRLGGRSADQEDCRPGAARGDRCRSRCTSAAISELPVICSSHG